MVCHAIMSCSVQVQEKVLLLRKVDKEVAKKRKKTGKISREKVSATRKKRSRLSPVEIEQFKELLLEKRREIMGNVNEISNEALRKSRLEAAGDLSSMPIHMADIGTDNFEQEFALDLVDGERKLLREIDDALQRIEEKTYGICEGTGKQIPKARIKAKPWARYCVEYARMLEQGTLTEPEE